MLSKPLCELFETAFSEKRLVRIQVEGVNLVVAVELLEPYSEEVRRAIWPESEEIWPVERQLKP